MALSSDCLPLPDRGTPFANAPSEATLAIGKAGAAAAPSAYARSLRLAAAATDIGGRAAKRRNSGGIHPIPSPGQGILFEASSLPTACLEGLPEIRTGDGTCLPHHPTSDNVASMASSSEAPLIRSLLPPPPLGVPSRRRALTVSRSCSVGIFPAMGICSVLEKGSQPSFFQPEGRALTALTADASDLVTPTFATCCSAPALSLTGPTSLASTLAQNSRHSGSAAGVGDAPADASEAFSISTVLTNGSGRAGREGFTNGALGAMGGDMMGGSGGRGSGGGAASGGGSSDRLMRRERHRRAAAAAERWHHPSSAMFRPASLVPSHPGGARGSGREGGGGASGRHRRRRGLRCAVELGEDNAIDLEGALLSSEGDDDDGYDFDDDEGRLGQGGAGAANRCAWFGLAEPARTHMPVPSGQPHQRGQRPALQGEAEGYLGGGGGGEGGGVRRMTLSSCCSPAAEERGAPAGGPTGVQRQDDDEFETPPPTPDGKWGQRYPNKRDLWVEAAKVFMHFVLTPSPSLNAFPLH